MRVYKNENVINVEFGTSSDINIEKMLYQWNKGQILHFLDIPENAEIQFSNKNAENTINKLLNNGNVEIPNTLLKTTDELFCVVQYIDKNSITTIKKITMSITENTKPSDYVAPDDKPTFREEMQDIMNETKRISESAEKKANSVVERANNGEFNGKDGEKGDTYTITEADYEAIANITKELIKVIDDNKDSGSDTTWSTDKIKTWLQSNYPTYLVMNNTIEAFLNNYYTMAKTDEKLALKQDVLTAGDNITIEDNVIAATVPDVDLSDYVKFTDTAKNNGTAGVVKVNNGVYGVKSVESGIIGIVSANDNEIEAQTSEFRAITPKNLKKAVETIGGNNVKPWRLIQNIDVTEELSALAVTVDSDGNPFEVDDIYVEMSNILGKNGSNLAVQLFPSKLRPSTYVGGVLIANPISATTKRHFFITFTKYKGLNKYKIEAFGKNATAYNNAYTHILPSNSAVISDSYKIREIQIYFSTGNYITAGNIKVYGR